MKHFLANSHENGRSFTSSDFEARLFRKYYGYPFYKGIPEGGSRAFMVAYNKYNGIPCAARPVMKPITMNERGQNGIICTDGGAFTQLLTTHHDYPNPDTGAAACIKAGITIFLYRDTEPIQNALAKGWITKKDLDDAVRGTGFGDRPRLSFKADSPTHGQSLRSSDPYMIIFIHCKDTYLVVREMVSADWNMFHDTPSNLTRPLSKVPIQVFPALPVVMADI